MSRPTLKTLPLRKRNAQHKGKVEIWFWNKCCLEGNMPLRLFYHQWHSRTGSTGSEMWRRVSDSMWQEIRGEKLSCTLDLQTFRWYLSGETKKKVWNKIAINDNFQAWVGRRLHCPFLSCNDCSAVHWGTHIHLKLGSFKRKKSSLFFKYAPLLFAWHPNALFRWVEKIL